MCLTVLYVAPSPCWSLLGVPARWDTVDGQAMAGRTGTRADGQTGRPSHGAWFPWQVLSGLPLSGGDPLAPSGPADGTRAIGGRLHPPQQGRLACPGKVKSESQSNLQHGRDKTPKPPSGGIFTVVAHSSSPRGTPTSLDHDLIPHLGATMSTFHDSSIRTLASKTGTDSRLDPSTVRVANDISPACRHSIPRATRPPWSPLAPVVVAVSLVNGDTPLLPPYSSKTVTSRLESSTAVRCGANVHRHPPPGQASRQTTAATLFT
jgi:hypothetical protein